MITDASVRAVVGVLIAEGRKLKAGSTLLKGQAQVVDRRPTLTATAEADVVVEVHPALNTLLPSEIEALRHAISPDLLKQMGWTINEKNGRVSKGAQPIFRPGFGTAINKVLTACQGSNNRPLKA